MNKIINEEERAVPITITIKRKYLVKIDAKRGLVSRSAWIMNKLEKLLDEIIEPEPIEVNLPDNKKGTVN